MDPDLVQSSYDALADAYAKAYHGELDHKPFDRMWLDRFAQLTVGEPVCDVGCGPGHVARYLHDRGVQAFGVDLSGETVRRAQELNPGVRYEQGDMRALDQPDGTLAGVTAFYAIVHFDLDGVAGFFREVHRVLMPGGRILAAFHIGEGHVHVDELLGQAVDMDFWTFQPDDVVARLISAGLTIEDVTIRYPYPDVEYPSRRAYILARR